MKQKTNRIAEQSKKWLVQALLDLMREKPYSSISVKEIADRAQLSRRTFYRNFKIKEDLLSEYFNYLFEDYTESLKELTVLSINDVLITYFEFWNKHINELKLLKQNHLFYLIMEQANSFIPNINKFENVKWHDYDNHTEEEYIGLYSIGGLWNVLSNWIDRTDRQSPQEMAQIIIKAFRNFSKSI
ncbi:AcrR family transcriptional regulator [Clostridium acetobutylicum]|uniref:Transcriptional regulator, AcrR family n=1 Tax=Clostridium acetobutylicum (strain ATCC 824 / DSM 792 / JCM 1419 / IAM 19013 / LMG 5710 / NBRC 13948 / NRRL B-527 / VKM B-1787 / 2291 / W) TaxID=272562 RepID=Q97L42_CLOAB|nr:MULTISPECIES: TetR/AcrR family transcriptional regulator [Clostridium]AAK78700.1 Transcriptional regulator, AcrR family [Clostridium acetobutylicum ATCC 824]ADZ19774.1 Transcriptional regulator, AcrR family [Clostridium acetobutylicum EA 2018]AEI31395.1 AcrR family transcriptional regulator [Clostridium acetobutylicum DSM 1731]AWV80419.1 TetR/AcrR family transcriptional regulator [Clostridium acetobutylicum]KHD37526.1 AcrR family transcriptional regulator [Clostridium acetobutylicum]